MKALVFFCSVACYTGWFSSSVNHVYLSPCKQQYTDT